MKRGFFYGTGIMRKNIPYLRPEKRTMVMTDKTYIEIAEIILQRSNQMKKRPRTVRLANIIKQWVPNTPVNKTQMTLTMIRYKRIQIIKRLRIMQYPGGPVDGRLGKRSKLLRAMQYRMLVIPHQHKRTRTPDKRQTLGRLRAIPDRVAKTNNLVRRFLFNCPHDRFERGKVRMNIADNR